MEARPRLLRFSSAVVVDGGGGGDDFSSLFSNLNTLLLSNPNPKPNPIRFPTFSSTSLRYAPRSTSRGPILKDLPSFERALIGAAAGAIAGAFTYVCLLPIDAVKTKLQTKGAANLYSNALDAAIYTLRTEGPLGFYRGVSAVLVGSATSSAIYFGTCELGKSVLGRLSSFPRILIPPTAGVMGNIVSSAIMVPKELITQRMQTGARGRSWEVLLRIIKKDGFLGLYAGYSATLLRNIPAGVLSYSSFEYLKAFVLSQTGQSHLEPAQSVCCGALAGAISASLTTPLDVVKTRLMTQAHGETGNKISVVVRQIMTEEGWIGFGRGIGPRVLHSACFAALGYCAFETARLAIHQYVQQRQAEEANALA
ncbi:protein MITOFERRINLIKE 1, chloroplastic [Dioscorea cayenensis subsp. rotundata]|uniref:Protein MITOFERRINLIKE 1, chloroplastic n=1 Tax=Dioscorea cayennensis subsp. rotundata TaxID=55577 RepID=A0AB40BC64_DIOCR|nr:protein MITOFERRINLIKE 1, chloroplastic [Dioscorea cayenensis subsp. rotundata]XP_039124899.1 protein MITOFERRINLIKE 1, chloroplastic [Dioscorea cayenensis subsp. rotundata]XP_039124900.1 protein MITOFERRINLIKE 1, chloroplastic [Dioscorea cayenensis subsp. rotundata]